MNAADAVDLTVDPCAGCRPLGALLALKGVEGAMTLVHGSQGCSTYMRLYLTRHFKEPFDVASSSLNENEAVYGGAQNLLKGVRNVLDKYDPSVLGVVTTCLSETIGDDVRSTLTHFVEQKLAKGMPAPRARLIHVSTPSYAGTMTEGYQAAVKAIVTELALEEAGDDRESGESDSTSSVATAEIPETPEAPDARAARSTPVSIILPLTSPAEVRSIKAMLREFGISAILIPDISETLDGGINGPHPLLPQGGASLSALRDAITSRAVLVLGEPSGTAVAEEEAPPPLQSDLCEAGTTLAMTAAAPLSLLPMPMGLRQTDAFLTRLAELSGGLPPHLRSARARYVDALADCHRLTYGKRIGIIAEPHLATAAAALLSEAGADVRVLATASKSPGLRAAVRAATSMPNGLPVVDAFLGGASYSASTDGLARSAEPQVLSASDHSSFIAACRTAGVELILGSAHAKAGAEELGLPLIRIGFPVYDRHGGHRQDHLFYDGSLRLLDAVCDALSE